MPPASAASVRLPEPALAALLAERAAFKRFIRRLELFCGACGRDACLRCACPPEKTPPRRKKT